MLVQLSIRDLVLIERVDLDLGPGLITLTGETGAGKSILLDGLDLALGGRADSSLVRPGAAEAVVTALFRIEPGHPALAEAAERGINLVEGELLIRRLVRADGGSRAFLNDEPVSAGLLRALGPLLVEVHGQHDERGLLNPRGHLALVDQFGGLEPLARAVAVAWTDLAGVRAALEEAVAAAAADAREREWLDHAVAELRAIDPRPGEEATLADLRARMQREGRLHEALDGVADLVSGADGAQARLRQAARRVERIAGDDPTLASLIDAIDAALVAGDRVEEVLTHARGADPVSADALDQAETRLFELRAAARKHRVEVEGLRPLIDTLAARLADVEDRQAVIERLEQALAEAEADYRTRAGALHAARLATAEALDAAVEAELPALKLGSARFRTRIATAEPGPSGVDQLQFEIATNDGPWGALTRIASGGELSRVILALKVALAGAGFADTLVFDEIDRGVGGAVASAIGRRLARLAAMGGGQQLLVVTHSPQVAAAGTLQLLIEKEAAGERVRTHVRRLDRAERVGEIARMLSGTTITPEARAQAERLLAADT